MTTPKISLPNHIHKLPAPDCIYDKDAPRAQTLEACVWLVSQFKISLEVLAQRAQHLRTPHPADYCEGRESGDHIFATLLCLACQNSFVWKLQKGVRQHRSRNRDIELPWQN